MHFSLSPLDESSCFIPLPWPRYLTSTQPIKALQEWRLLHSHKASKNQGFEQKLWVHHLRHQQGEGERRHPQRLCTNKERPKNGLSVSKALQRTAGKALFLLILRSVKIRVSVLPLQMRTHWAPPCTSHVLQVISGMGWQRHKFRTATTDRAVTKFWLEHSHSSWLPACQHLYPCTCSLPRVRELISRANLSDESKTWFSACESWLASGKFKGSSATCHIAEQPLSQNDRWCGSMLRYFHQAVKCSTDVGEQAVWQPSGLCRGCCKVAEKKEKEISLISMEECQTVRACLFHHWILPCGHRDL